MAIVATNVQSHIDEAFARRFQSAIKFPMPDAQQRLRLWEDNFKDKPYALEASIDLQQLARGNALSGGNIVNVLRYACLSTALRLSEGGSARPAAASE